MKIEEEINQTKPFVNPQIKAIVNLLFSGSWLSAKQARMLKPFGLSMQQYNILRILKGMHPEPATVKLLIERMIDKTSNASRLVDKLKLKGLVERKACKVDRRRVDVMITAEGIVLLERIAGLMDNDQDIINLNDEEANLLSDLLDKMRTE